MSFREAISNKFRLQQIGFLLLLISIIFLLKEIIIPCYIILGIILIIDLYLAYKDKKEGNVLTITQWFRPLFPKVVDVIFTLGLIGVFIYFNPLFGLYFLVGTIHGHLSGDW